MGFLLLPKKQKVMLDPGLGLYKFFTQNSGSKEKRKILPEWTSAL